MNLFGLDVTRLDADAWAAGARLLFPWLGALWLLLVARTRRAGLLLCGVLLANAWLWGVTNFPLQRPYGLGASHDRLNNMGLCRVVAAEGRPLESIQVGQLQFEPFWGALVTLLAGGDPDRIPALYPFFALFAPLAFGLCLWAGLRPGSPGPEGGWERAVVVGFATLLSSAPLEFLGTYRVPWAMLFLLKPNHSLGLILLPLLLLVLSRPGRARSLLAGLLLQLMGWAFVLHMSYTVVGLCLFALRSWLDRREERRAELTDTLIVLGINALIVSPYVYMLVVGYPFMVPLARNVVRAGSPHLIEGTLASGWLFLLAVWGFRVLERRGDRLARLLNAQWLGALVVWAGYLLLSALHLARELDEIYQWLRFVTAILAGFGAWDLAGRAAVWLRGRELGAPARAVALAAVVLPLALPSWWDPRRMDPFFEPSLEPLPAALVEPAEWLRTHSRPGETVAGDHSYGHWVSALAGRRILLAARMHGPPAQRQRWLLEYDLFHGTNLGRARSLAGHYRVRYLTVSRKVLRLYRVRYEDLEARPDLALRWKTRERARGFEPMAIFELVDGVRP